MLAAIAPLTPGRRLDDLAQARTCPRSRWGRHPRHPPFPMPAAGLLRKTSPEVSNAHSDSRSDVVTWKTRPCSSSDSDWIKGGVLSDPVTLCFAGVDMGLCLDERYSDAESASTIRRHLRLTSSCNVGQACISNMRFGNMGHACIQILFHGAHSPQQLQHGVQCSPPLSLPDWTRSRAPYATGVTGLGNAARCFAVGASVSGP